MDSSRKLDSPSSSYSRRSPEDESPTHESSPSANRESSCDYETHVDPIELIDELGDLQQASTLMLNMLISDHKRPALAVKFAQEARLAGPNESTNRRLTKLDAKLRERMGKFTENMFIDVTGVAEMIPSLTKNGKIYWAPTPILYSANCARLALEVLFAIPKSEDAKETVRALEGIFPASFVPPQLSEKLEGAVFDLALEIRTQFFIAELETRQKEKVFDPAATLQQVFKEQVGSKDNFVRYIRGFASTSQFLNGDNRMPTRFHDKVLERVQDLEDLLLIVIFEDKLDITELMSAYPWTRIVLNTARLLAAVSDSLKSSVKSQPSVEDVTPDLIKKINDRSFEIPGTDNSMIEKLSALGELQENSRLDTTLAESETLVDSFHLEDELDNDTPESHPETHREEHPSKRPTTHLETHSPASSDDIYETILKGRQHLSQRRTNGPPRQSSSGNIFAAQKSATRPSVLVLTLAHNPKMSDNTPYDARKQLPGPLSRDRDTAWAARNTSREAENPTRAPRQGHSAHWTTEEDQRLLDLVGTHGFKWALILEADRECPAVDGGPVFKPYRQAQALKDRARTVARNYYDSGQPIPQPFVGIKLGKNYPKNR
ncbi:hypothetical protein N7495_009563 [Penicillium taxi]|uniref:uncharacterized protein n=1 Tax=Penicillium taxi TaxID=168475 RepID=UPI0025452392|nr:uncharacterized protein N7495_009563 [Penicillium taxi]KAJ5885053.1 hypothetical protein N7495_009563 [Penicillium taxi]